MDKADKKVIDKQDDDTLAIWWNKINCFEIIEEFSKPHEINVTFDKPLCDWTKEEINLHKNSRASSIMKYIQEKIGFRKCSREGSNRSMSDEEFNDFYDGTYLGDMEAKRRHEITTLKNLATSHKISHDLIDFTRDSDEIMNQLCGIYDERNNEVV